MLAPVIHILPLTTIQRERLLPVAGRIVVRKGQKVSASDVVGEARLNTEHLLLDIARGLGISYEKADSQIQCKPGERVLQGDVLAGPIGLAKRVVRAPRDGRVIVAGGGKVLLELDDVLYELKAGLPGTVSALLKDRGVMIQTTGALIQGVWGNGHVDYGLMFFLARAQDDILTSDRMDVSLRGSVIVGGYCEDVEVLKTAADITLRGLILASLDPSLMPVAEKMSYPIIVLEGLGRIPMNSVTYNLLSTNERRELSLNAQKWDRYQGKRPEIIIPLPAPGELPLPPETDLFTVGQQVRVVSAPYISQIGTIVELRSGMTTLPNGLYAPAAGIQFDTGEKSVVPLANLEVIE